ncbi:MAG: PilZ domain-containing protein [Gemmataceae bacterium]|nr:PilZ domain-containing protein [Gemmataceae bacterium]
MSSSDDLPDVPAYLVSERTHVRLPSKPDWIEPAADWLRRKAVLAGACHESRSGKLLVAFHEALSNAIIHGNLGLSSTLKELGDDSFARALAERTADPVLSKRLVEVAVECEPDYCRWIITDEGDGFDVEAVLARGQSEDPELALASGRGILIIKSLLDEVRWELGGRRIVLGLSRSSGAEKRRALRVPRHEPVRVAPILANGDIAWDQAHSAVVRDLSTTGVGLLQDCLIQSERIVVGLTINHQTVYVPAEIKHCRSTADGLLELGCRFQTPQPDLALSTTDSLSDHDLEAAIDRLLAPASAAAKPTRERRRHPRAPYTKRVEIRAGPDAAPVVGFVRNLSRGGIALIASAPLPAEVTIVVPTRDGSAVHAVRCRVLRCQRIVDSFYDVAAQFVGFEAPSTGQRPDQLRTES